MPTKQLLKNKKHFEACHQRWMDMRNRRQEDNSYKDEWYAGQCGACWFFIRLSGLFTEDYGGCSNPESKFDKNIMFEHDGCNNFFLAETLKI